MRRSRFQFLLFFVALTLQVLGPIAGNLAHAEAFRGSSVAGLVCHSSEGAHRQGKGSQNPHIDHKHCLLCQSFSDSLSLTIADGHSALLSSSSWVVGAFPAQQDLAPAFREAERYRARAPPIASLRLG